MMREFTSLIQLACQHAHTQQRNATVSVMTHLDASDWPLHSYAQSRVIGYNVQHCKIVEKK